jgi:hypothetical protein
MDDIIGSAKEREGDTSRVEHQQNFLAGVPTNR